MRKREKFAVSLRKQKTRDIISAKRRRLLDSNNTLLRGSDQAQINGSAGKFVNISHDVTRPEYSGFFSKDEAQLVGKLLSEIAPDYHNQEDEVSVVNIANGGRCALNRLEAL